MPGTQVSGAELRRAFRTAFDRLEEYRETVNALNVFPVPDGDTGTNMSLTLRSGIERCQDGDGLTAGEVAEQLAQGTFFGARGTAASSSPSFSRDSATLFRDATPALRRIWPKRWTGRG